MDRRQWRVFKWLVCFIIAVLMLALFGYCSAQLKDHVWKKEPTEDFFDEHLAGKDRGR